MPYVEGKWGRFGLELGQAQEQYKRDKAYREERARAEARVEEDRAREREERRADAEMGSMKLRGMEQEALQAAGELKDPRLAERRKSRVAMQFDRVRETAKRLSPENRAQYLEDAKLEMRQHAVDRARKKVAAGIQDRRARGAYNFLDETEPNEAIEQRLDMLAEGLDSQQLDPMAAAEIEHALLTSVREENRKRLARKRGDTMIDSLLTKAVDTGNQALAQSLEALKAMWGTGELEADDLADKLFEAQYGRKTARAAGPTPFEVRQAATKLFVEQEGRLPTPEELRPLVLLLNPPEMPTPTRADVIASVTANGGARGTEADPRTTTRAAQGASAEEPSTGSVAAAPTAEGVVPRGTSEAPAKKFADSSGQAAPAGVSEADEEGGRPIRPWGKIRAAERKNVIATLKQAMIDGTDLEKAARGVGVDLESLPEAIVAELEKSTDISAITGPEYAGAGLP